MVNPAKKPDVDSITISAGGKSVTVTPEQLKQAGAPISNTEVTFLAISKEMITLEDEIDRVMEPLKERRKDLTSVAKDAKLNIAALKRSVKIKRADNAKRKKYAEEIQAEEQYLHWLQIDLFPAAA